LWFGVYDAPSIPDPDWLAPISGSGSLEQVSGSGSLEPSSVPDSCLQPQFSLSKSEYSRQIRAIKEHLLEGNVYQINLTGSFGFEFGGHPLDLYRQLRGRQPVGYNACLITDDRVILSCSPELFFRRDGERIWTRPMKGTVRRGANSDEDVVLSNWLQTDSKSRAENLMIVDLLRNDLARICVVGSVEVSEMFNAELYHTVIQLTTTVSGTLKSDTSYADIFSALFPCGSVTGAPKVRAMQVIREIERRRRGVYTGAIGYAGPGKQAVFSVAIRTVSLTGSGGEMGSGGGIVWDSSAEAEYRECLLKASFLTGQAMRPDLIETMVWDGGYQRIDRHLRRLESSARELGYPIDLHEIRKRLERVAQTQSPGPSRVRLLLHPDGQVTIWHRPLTGPSIVSGTVVISRLRTNPEDIWLYHKSTRREVYDAEYASAISAGHVEVIFCNRRGEVTEGSRSNLFIRRGTELVTPVVGSGLLAGTRRAEVLETMPGAVESVLHAEDLYEADEILLCNGTTALTPVVLSISKTKNLD
ncbi:MAG: aminodeoxychorismate synthase component I, partial [Rhodothermia bacterium]